MTFDSAATRENLAVAYAQGAAAHRRNEPIDNVPYAPEGMTGKLYDMWVKGWCEERLRCPTGSSSSPP